MKTVATIIFLLTTIHSFSQTREVTIKPCYSPAKAFPVKDRYKFPEFLDGFIITFEGKRSQPLKLNFNEFSSLPQFIDKSGDTLFLDEHMAKSVHIAGVAYLHHSAKNFYELLSDTEPVKLAIDRRWKLSRVETVYVDGKSNQTTVSFSRNQGNAIYCQSLSRTVRNENTVFRRDSSYYFIDAKGRDFRADDSSLMRLFSNYKDEIKEYLKKEEIDFDNEEDLRKILEFCSSL